MRKMKPGAVGRAWRALLSWLRCWGCHDWHQMTVRWAFRPDLPPEFRKCWRCGLTSDGRYED